MVTHVILSYSPVSYRLRPQVPQELIGQANFLKGQEVRILSNTYMQGLHTENFIRAVNKISISVCECVYSCAGYTIEACSQMCVRCIAKY